MYVVLTIPVEDTIRNVRQVKEKTITLGDRS